MSDLIFIRTHRFGEVEDRLATQLSRAFGSDNVALCVDESRGPVDTGRWRKSSLTRARAEELVGGPVPDDWGWRMGDLCHIAVGEDFGPRSHQWLIESDVHIPNGHEDEIFGTLRAIPGDFLACNLQPKKVKSMAEAVSLVLPTAEWGCVFALNRLKGEHVAAVRDLRRRLTVTLAAASRRWKVPNDEAVVANLGAASGWKLVDLYEAAPGILQQNWFDTNPPFLRRALDEAEGSTRISHPVLDLDQLFRRIEDPNRDGHQQQYKLRRLSRIIKHLTPEEKARMLAALPPEVEDEALN